VSPAPREPRSKAWKDARLLAESYLDQPELGLAMCHEAGPEIERLAERMRHQPEVLEAARLMARLARAWCRHPEAALRPPVPREAAELALAAVIYLVGPDDAIPDNVPFFGLKDDIEVLAFVRSHIDADLQRYREWEQHRSP
jgi:uncharacterized membrane protein YkvA (DUF1232 family)